MEMIKERELEQVGIIMIKPKIKDSLCTSCHNNKNCTLTSNKNGVYQCSEYAREQFLLKMDISEPSYYSTPNEIVEAAGLCKTCDLRYACSLIEEGTVKFYCQHYQ
jgi:hypothetical protein